MNISKRRPWVLAIDFDGTICEESFPEVGKLKEDADVYINMLYDEGYHIVINTCRSGKYEGMAHEFLKKIGIKYHYLNNNMPYLIEEYGQDCRKISADVYIDNKNLFGVPKTWEEIYNQVTKLRENDNRN
jgi:hypothetical protein